MSYLGIQNELLGRRRSVFVERRSIPSSDGVSDAPPARQDPPREASGIGVKPAVPHDEFLGAAAQGALALLLLIFVLPLMIILALAVCMQDGGPPIFRHRRVGRHGAPFLCLKFRTMRVDAEARLAELLAADPEARRQWAADQKLKNDPRITRLGRFLRKSSLDELPQLINILRGEMNLVGPRPIVEGEIPRYGWRYKHYQAVKPGITGLWQISGRNEVSYRTRVALDSLYSMKKSPGLDLWIVASTVPAVLFTRGSY